MWVEMLGEIFTHSVQACTTTKDAYGVSTVTAVSTLCCYCFQDADIRLVGGDSAQTLAPGWKMVFQAADKDSVTTGHLLQNATDADGSTIFTQARITGITPYRHWSEGLQCVVAELELS
jgi:hypothetical protein